MTERDKLKKMLIEAFIKCEDNYGIPNTEQVADYLIANGVIVLPCKKGDSLFILTSDSPTGIEETKCRKINIVNSQYGIRAKVIAPCVYDDWGNAFRGLYDNDFGETVFLTREEAEKELERRKTE